MSETLTQLARPSHTAVGTVLPELRIPVTATLIVTGAIATRDFQLVHHDRAAALAAGTKDVFMNILTTNGLVNRFVGGWAGPTARITRINIRLGATNFPGDELVLNGTIDTAEGDELSIAIVGTNKLGTHVTGTVYVTIPARKETA